MTLAFKPTPEQIAVLKKYPYIHEEHDGVSLWLHLKTDGSACVGFVDETRTNEHADAGPLDFSRIDKPVPTADYLAANGLGTACPDAAPAEAPIGHLVDPRAEALIAECFGRDARISVSRAAKDDRWLLHIEAAGDEGEVLAMHRAFHARWERLGGPEVAALSVSRM